MLSRELTASEKRMIFRLVKKHCANYDSKYGCLPLDADCYMTKIGFKDSKLCKYYEDAVLPIEPEIKAYLNKSNQHLKVCGVCGEAFFANKNRRYCSDKCKYIARKKNAALRKKKERNRKNGGEIK